MNDSSTPIDLLPIYITREDKERLRKMMLAYQRERNLTAELKAFATELERAMEVEPHHLPDGIVRMNSRVTIEDLDTSEEFTFTIVFPQDADPEEEKLSILAPLAAAVLGYDCGDEIEWNVPEGRRRFRITDVSHNSEES